MGKSERAYPRVIGEGGGSVCFLSEPSTVVRAPRRLPTSKWGGAKRDLWLAGNSEANFSCGQCNQQHEVGDNRPMSASSRFCPGCPPLLSSCPSCISRGRIGDRHHGFTGRGKGRGADHRRWRLSHTKGRAVLLSKCWLGRRGKTVAWQVARRGNGDGSRCLSDPRARPSQEAGFRAAAWVGGPGSPRRQKEPGSERPYGTGTLPGADGFECLPGGQRFHGQGRGRPSAVRWVKVSLPFRLPCARETAAGGGVETAPRRAAG
jgi:hypothetical protein